MPRPIGCESEYSQGTLRILQILQEGHRLCDQEFLIDLFTMFAIGHSWLNLSMQASTDACIDTDDFFRLSKIDTYESSLSNLNDEFQR